MSERDDDLTGAYALDALTPDEREAFERRLRGSESLRTEAGELSDTAAELGLAVRAEAPPASLKADLMARIAQTPQVAPAPQLAPVAEGEPVQASSPAEERARGRWFSRPAAAITSIAAAAALILGGGIIANTAVQQGQRQEQADVLAAINAADDVQRVTSEVEGGTATWVFSRELERSAFIVEGFEPLPADSTYELWYVDDAGARPAGLFGVDESGSGWQVLDGRLGADDAVGVTVEPVGGSTTPTTDPVVFMTEPSQASESTTVPTPQPPEATAFPVVPAPTTTSPATEPGQSLPGGAGDVVSGTVQGTVDQVGDTLGETVETGTEVVEGTLDVVEPVTEPIDDLLGPLLGR